MTRCGNKFGNKRTTVDGIAFASKAEAKRYSELRLLEKAKLIFRLKLQPRFKLEVDGVPICVYVGDFQYYKFDANGEEEEVLEDVKGFRTPEYELKRKLMYAIHGIEIQEIGGNRRKATKKLAKQKTTKQGT